MSSLLNVFRDVEFGGAWIGWAEIGRPFAHLSINEEELVLSAVFGGKLVFPKKDIIALSKYQRRLNVGVRIHHDVPQYPKLVVFMVSSAVSNKRFMLLAEKLRTFGYEVKGDYPSPLLFRIFAAIILITLGAVGAMALFGFVIYFLRTFL